MDTAERFTVGEIVDGAHLTATITPAEKNPHMEADREWHDTASHWRVTIRNTVTGQRMVTFFSQGSAHTQPPTLLEVLDCLASDAAGLENARTFEEWAQEYGYAEDSRRAERAYRTIQRQADALKRVVGGLYQALLWNTERL